MALWSLQADKKKQFNLPIVALHFLLLFFLGTLQDGYIINLFSRDAPLLISREGGVHFFYPLNTDKLLESLILDPRWISFIIYTAGFFLLTLSLIYFLFKRKAYIRHVLIVYAILISTSIILVILSFATNSYETGYKLAQGLKTIYQSPLITFILIAFLYFLDQQKKA